MDLTSEMLSQLLRAEAAEALKSSASNGEYSTAFYVAHIILSSLADRLANNPTGVRDV